YPWAAGSLFSPRAGSARAESTPARRVRLRAAGGRAVDVRPARVARREQVAGPRAQHAVTAVCAERRPLAVAVARIAVEALRQEEGRRRAARARADTGVTDDDLPGIVEVHVARDEVRVQARERNEARIAAHADHGSARRRREPGVSDGDEHRLAGGAIVQEHVRDTVRVVVEGTVPVEVGEIGRTRGERDVAPVVAQGDRLEADVVEPAGLRSEE